MASHKRYVAAAGRNTLAPRCCTGLTGKEHIQPGKPQQNAYVERFNRTIRYEWLSQYYWSGLDDVREYATQWMWRYNHERLNMALGGITPKQRLAITA